jgi:hypothetical protein
VIAGPKGSVTPQRDSRIGGACHPSVTVSWSPPVISGRGCPVPPNLDRLPLKLDHCVVCDTEDGPPQASALCEPSPKRLSCATRPWPLATRY